MRQHLWHLLKRRDLLQKPNDWLYIYIPIAVNPPLELSIIFIKIFPWLCYESFTCNIQIFALLRVTKMTRWDKLHMVVVQIVLPPLCLLNTERHKEASREISKTKIIMYGKRHKMETWALIYHATTQSFTLDQTQVEHPLEPTTSWFRMKESVCWQ